jgi:alpha-D-ribose 1-methylphosphonate 5-triphosphate synthase subunit PhnG
MKQQTARQHWLSVLAHSEASQLEAHWQPLKLNASFERVRPAETGCRHAWAAAVSAS